MPTTSTSYSCALTTESNDFPQTSSSNSKAQSNVFPLVGEVIKLVNADKPGQGFRELEQVLLEAGIFTSEQILLLPEDVLSAINDIGRPRARILRNYAKRVVLPLLGLLINHEEPEFELDSEVKNKRARYSEEAEIVLECGNSNEVEGDEDSDDEQWEDFN
jgi:hypothetical protein